MAAMKTLLEKAMEAKVQKRPSDASTDQEQELALEWLQGNITLSQVAAAYGWDSQHCGNTYPKLARSLKAAWGRKRLVVK